MFNLNPYNRVPPHTWSKSHRLGELEAEAYARQVALAQAGRERTLTRFVPSSIPDPDDEIVEYGGIEAWTWEADDSDEEIEIVPERMPDDEDEEIASLADFLWDEDADDQFVWAEEVIASFESTALELWVDDPDENGELSRPKRQSYERDRDQSKVGRCAFGCCHTFVSWKVSGRARHAWAQYPHRHHRHGVTEVELASRDGIYAGYREAVKRRLAERGVTGVTVEVIPRSRAA